MSRRIDTELRSAISKLESMMLSEPNIEDILTKTLSQLIPLLKCQFGFVFRCQTSEQPQHIPWQFCAALEQKDEEIKRINTLCTSTEIPQSLLQDLSIGRCWYANEVEDSLKLNIPLPAEHPALQNFMAIPLADAKNIYGLMFVANTITPFDETSVRRMRPFIAATNCLLRASIKRDQVESFNSPKITINDTILRLPHMLDSMFNAVLVINQFDIVVMCNNAAAALLESSKCEIIGRIITTFLPSGAPKLPQQGNESETTISTQQTVWRGVRINTTQNKKQLVDLRSYQIKSEQKPLNLLIMDDISEKIESTANYHNTLQRFEVLTNLAPVGILQIDSNWECTYANDTWCRFCQMTQDENLGTNWLKGLHHSDADEFLAKLRTQTKLEGTYSAEVRLITPYGHVTWVQANACALYDDRGSIKGLIMTFNDITEHLNTEQYLKNIAEKDQLTGLINRTFFNDRVEIALRGVKRFGSVALMFIDLDEFKHINDTLGHDVGDALLIEVAERLKRNVRNVDSIARIGGDEFTVLLTNVQNTRSITVVADKLIETFAVPFHFEGRPMYVSGSIGIAVAEDRDANVKQLLKQADIALYKAKESGRNQYKFYTHELNQDADLHIHLRQSLKEAARNDFRVVYQPQVNAKTGEIIGVEALTRWQHDDAKPTGPDKFIKMIEESGLIHEFSNWLLEDVFESFDKWRKKSPAFHAISLSINLSAKQFRSKELAKDIELRAKKHGIPPQSVVLEITETALIDDHILATNTITQLRKAGFKISLDDFGTGYSSLAYLRTLPFNYIKIDKSFIQNVTKQDGDATIVVAILNLTRALKMDVVAEGVDNNDVSEWLVHNQCPIHQGFYYHRPLEKSDFETLVMQQTAA